MKKFLCLALISGFLFMGPVLIAQPPPPPNNPGDVGGTGANAPVGAPVGNGSIIILSFLLVYAGMKLYRPDKISKAV